MRESLSKKELEQLNKLQAKQKRIERHNSEFRSEVLERKDEVIKLLDLETTFQFPYEEKIKKLTEFYNLGEERLMEVLLNEKVKDAILKYIENH